MLQALSEKAKAETQFIQQLKAMTERIPVSNLYFVTHVTSRFREGR